ncbi:hypothetical protein ACS0TY_016271 [Phlomoides rotata]
MVDRIISKFVGWKGASLSLAGWACLINSVIVSSLVHSMMIYRWPRSLLNKVDRAMRNFLWTGSTQKTGFCTVNWTKVCAPKEEGGFGIRNIKTANEAFLQRLAWNILNSTEPSMLFVRARFFKGRSLDPGRHSSVNFWLDNWLGYSIADRLGIPNFVRDYLDFSVTDYFFDDAWHLDELFVTKHMDIVQDILHYSCEAEDDTLVWPLELHGEIRAKGAYRAAQHHFPEVSLGKWIWGSFIPVKRSALLWRVIHSKVPTWYFLQCRGFAGPSRCVLCGNHSEDMDHLWCHCPWARALFEKVSAVFSANLSFDFGFYHWLLQAMTQNFSPQVLSIWRLGVVTMVWLVWDQRNRCIFYGATARSSHTLAQFWALMREVNGCNIGCMKNTVFDLSVLSEFGIIGRPSKAPSSICIRWHPPPIRFIKANIDGGAAGAPGRLTGGGVFRDNFGVFRGCFAMHHGSGFAFEAELATTFSAVEIAFDKHWLHLWLETDSIYVVNILKHHTSLVPWRLLGQWHRVRRMMGDMQIVVSHIFREGNTTADRLTREPVDGFEWWGTVPDFLNPFINRDKSIEFYCFSM